MPTDQQLRDCKISLKRLLESHKVFRKHLARDLSGDTKITKGKILPSSHMRSGSMDFCSQDFIHSFVQLILLIFVQVFHTDS